MIVGFDGVAEGKITTRNYDDEVFKVILEPFGSVQISLLANVAVTDGSANSGFRSRIPVESSLVCRITRSVMSDKEKSSLNPSIFSPSHGADRIKCIHDIDRIVLIIHRACNIGQKVFELFR